MTQDQVGYDAIVIGSGIGGLSCAAALTRTGHKVLVLEQHYVAGGLTQTFQRHGFRWDVGVHYIGEMGPEGEAFAILDWLAEGAIKFASMGAVYDIIHFPGDFEICFGRPEASLTCELKEKFPQSVKEIDAFFAAMAKADRTARSVFALRAMPEFLAKIYRLWQKGDIDKWWGRSSGQVLTEMIGDPKLRAVLLAQKGNYGGAAADDICFGLHALIMRHYFNGAYYPVGGARVFADALIPVIQRGGGEIRLKARVVRLLAEKDAVVGVELEDGTQIRAPRVFSDIGVRNTIGLLPADMRDSAFAREALSFAPSACHVALYLGLEGDIRANGASASNYLYHESWDLESGPWSEPASDAPPPGLFISFPSLKDPTHEPGEKQRHTAEVIATASWGSFARWQDTARRARPEDYTAFKAAIERNLKAQFARRFPALAPMVTASELSTPLTTLSFTGAQQGGIYGLEVTPRRFLTDSLRMQTPIPGLLLTGQDVVAPGVTGAMMGGVFAAAAIEPRIYPRLR